MAVTYEVYIEPEVHAGRQSLPGHVRQRVRRMLDDLATEPRPPQSRLLNTSDLAAPAAVEIRRVRLERWRIVYAVNDSERWVWILGVYRRPPYDYADLAGLVAKLPE